MSAKHIIIEDAQINAALEKAVKAGADKMRLLQNVAGYMLFSVQRRFETETDPEGVKWKKLSPRTVRAKVRGNRRRGSRNILRVSNRLYGSIIGEVNAIEAIVGTNLIYAGIHQSGGKINKPARKQNIRLRKVNGRTRFAKKSHKRARDLTVNIGAHTIIMPKRSYLGFSETDRAEIIQIAEDHFEAATSGALK